MRFTSYILAASAALLGSGVVQGLTVNPKTITPPKHLYSFSLKFTDNYAFSGPLGNRVGLGLTGGDMTAPNGTLIGKFIPGIGGETGILDTNGNLQIDVRGYVKFTDELAYAFLHITGVGPLAGKPYDAHHIETNSTTRSAWNTYFVAANVTLVNPALLIGDAFAWSTSA
ncbi:hypothetical protein RhiJN_21157 [Ceratobasidium sp. AG-Ba]|nr:hypothetical protein RhiJN_21157 [Ceratobasidium sp. AG-Ba]